MVGRLLVYGATGFTGRMIAERAVAAGFDVLLAGRSPTRLAAIADELSLSWTAVGLDDPEEVVRMVTSADLLINAAGPFAETAPPLIDGCLRGRRPYLDISAEIATFEYATVADRRARELGVTLMPGAGYGIIASDCAAAYVAAQAPRAAYLRLAVTVPTSLSVGSVRTILALAASNVLIRRAGRLVHVPVGRLERDFDYGDGPCRSMAINWPDVLTAYRSTGIRNIEVYARTSIIAGLTYQMTSLFATWLRLRPVERLLRMQLDAGASSMMPSPASASQVLVAEVEDPWRERRAVRFVTNDAYSFTATMVIDVARRVLAGDSVPGFQTPATLYGGRLPPVANVVVEEIDDYYNLQRGAA